MLTLSLFQCVESLHIFGDFSLLFIPCWWGSDDDRLMHLDQIQFLLEWTSVSLSLLFASPLFSFLSSFLLESMGMNITMKEEIEMLKNEKFQLH